MWNSRGSRIAEVIFKRKNKVVWNWWKERQIVQWNRREGPEMGQQMVKWCLTKLWGNSIRKRESFQHPHRRDETLQLCSLPWTLHKVKTHHRHDLQPDDFRKTAKPLSFILCDSPISESSIEIMCMWALPEYKLRSPLQSTISVCISTETKVKGIPTS